MNNNYRHVRIFIYLTLAFFFFLVLGTLLHECGHIIVARLLGYKTVLHFGSMDYFLTNGYGDISVRHDLLVTLGGVATTIIIGTTAFLCIKPTNNLRHWVLVYFAMFWVREPINLLLGISKGFLGLSENYFGGDEFLLSKYMGLVPGFFSVILGVLGHIICVMIWFFHVRREHKKTFILAGVIGGCGGYYLWLYVFGPLLLP